MMSRPIVLTALLVASMIATLSGALSTAVSAQTAEPSPRLTLVDSQFAFDAGDELQLDYVLTGVDLDALELGPQEPPPAPPTTAPPTTIAGAPPPAPAPPPPPPPDPVQLTIEVTNYEPLGDPDDVADVVGSPVDPDAFDSVVDGVAISDARELITVDGDEVRMSLVVGTDVEPSVEDRLRFDEPGIYPLRVQLLVGDPEDDAVVATAGTIVERLAGPNDPGTGLQPVAPPIDLAVVTAVSAPTLDATPAESATAERALLDSITAAAELESPLALAVPPFVVASTFDDAADAAELRESLVDDEFVSLPIIPLDVSAAVEAGRAEEYTRLLNAGEDLLSDLAPTTPTRREAWIALDPLSTGGAQQLRDLGARYVAMPAALYADTVDADEPPIDQFVEATLPDGAVMPIIVLDTLDDSLDPDVADEVLESNTATDWATITLGRMLVEQGNADRRLPTPAQRSRVLAAPDLGAPDTRLLGRLEALTQNTPSVRFGPASTLGRLTDTAERGGEPVSVTLPASAGPSLVERLERIDAAALSLASAASMLADDDPRRDAWQDGLDELISTGYTDAAVDEQLGELLREAEELTDAVRLPEPFTFTLTGRSGTIEVRLTNTSDESLRVLLALDSTKLDFPDGVQEVVLRPQGETAVNVAVEARSNGTSSVNVAVSTPLGEPLDEPVVLTSRVTALTGLGQVLTGGFILVLLTWWFAHWRNRRRDRLTDDGRARHPSSRDAEAEDEVPSDAL